MDIKRDFYLNKLIERKHDGFVKFITGIRRCGKSHLLNVQFRNHLRSQGIGDSQVIGLALDDDANCSLQAFVQIPKVCSELPMMMPKTIDKRWTRGMDITVQDKDLRRCVEKLFDELGANLLSEATGTRKKRTGWEDVGRGTRGGAKLPSQCASPPASSLVSWPMAYSGISTSSYCAGEFAFWLS